MKFDDPMTKSMAEGSIQLFIILIPIFELLSLYYHNIFCKYFSNRLSIAYYFHFGVLLLFIFVYKFKNRLMKRRRYIQKDSIAFIKNLIFNF